MRFFSLVLAEIGGQRISLHTVKANSVSDAVLSAKQELHVRYPNDTIKTDVFNMVMHQKVEVEEKQAVTLVAHAPEYEAGNFVNDLDLITKEFARGTEEKKMLERIKKRVQKKYANNN